MAQGDYTQFRLYNLPSDIDIKVAGVAAIEGQWYNNGQAITAEKQNADDYGSPFAIIEYQTTDGTLTSERTPIYINCLVNPGTTPGAVNYSNTILNNDTVNLTASLLQLNDGVDRIKILTFKAAGDLTVNGGAVIPNQIINRKDLATFQFVADAIGFGPEYQKITYQVGNSNGYEATIYDVTLTIAGTADLTLDSTVTYESPGVYKGAVYTLKIPSGIPGGVADIDVAVALSNQPVTAGTQVTISGYDSGNNIVTVNQTVNIDETIPENIGELTFIVEVKVVNADLPENGTITCTLNTIDGNASYVSGSNVVVINLSFSP